MPKEITSDEVMEKWYVEITWRGSSSDGQEGHVQVATVNPDSEFEYPEVDTGTHFHAAEKFDGFRVTLSRAGINRLIRSLRKARDAAFERDA